MWQGTLEAFDTLAKDFVSAPDGAAKKVRPASQHEHARTGRPERCCIGGGCDGAAARTRLL